VSLCHSAYANLKKNNEKIEIHSNNDLPIDLVIEPLDLPTSRTDWQKKVRQLKIKSIVSSDL